MVNLVHRRPQWEVHVVEAMPAFAGRSPARHNTHAVINGTSLALGENRSWPRS